MIKNIKVHVKVTRHKLKHNLHAHTRRDSQLYLKSIAFMGK